MKNVLIINGHPYEGSFNHALAQAYKKGAEGSGANVVLINITDLKFNPNLQFGYTKRIDLEPDLLYALDEIKRANHIVWVHPVWWGGFPAIMKGFIDRVFLPGITFQPRPNSVMWDKLLKGRTARIITTIDQPSWYYRIVYSRPSVNQLRKCILEFCGVKPVKVSYVGIIKTSDDAKRLKWLDKAYKLGVMLR